MNVAQKTSETTVNLHSFSLKTAKGTLFISDIKCFCDITVTLEREFYIFQVVFVTFLLY